MEEKLKISVIIPAYNVEEYIGRCLDSILEQTYQNFEVIIVNDGSNDNTSNVLAEYAKKYPQKIIHIDQENAGAAAARNNAMKSATGDYIAYIDSDDYMDKDYFETLITNSDNGKMDAVLSGYRKVNEDGKILLTKKLKDYDWSKFIIPTPWARIYKREFILKNNIDYIDNNIGEDIYFTLIAMFATKNVKILDYIGYNYFFNNESLSNSKQKDFRKLNIFNLLNKCYDALKDRNLLEENFQTIEFFFYRYIIWFLLFSSKKQSNKDINLEYDKLFSWLEERFPKYKKNKLIGLNKPKGEFLSTRSIYLIFMRCHQMHLGKFLMHVYAKV